MMKRQAEEERLVAQQLIELERRRSAVTAQLVGKAGQGPGAVAGGPAVTLEALARTVDRPRSERLRELGAELKRLVAQVRRESAIVHGAASSLSRHIGGILQSVYGALSQVGVYERRGRLAVGSGVESFVDVRS